MEIFLVTIFIVGIISAVFGVLLIFAPDVILRVEEKANILYMTDTAFLKIVYHLELRCWVFRLLSYTYSIITINEITFLLIAIVAGIFGILLLVSPNTILIMERQANKIYMTDTFFFENRVVIGIALLLASGFMIKTYLSFS
ncbi:MAG: hypothetical protein CM15mP4_2200 [Candidatus Neomarinimicrobiota bacterium]|nr:MAG: hypothetical protein CM15mP4_2200 [Candidatus Neomarinimicrobiota bacterium]